MAKAETTSQYRSLPSEKGGLNEISSSSTSGGVGGVSGDKEEVMMNTTTTMTNNNRYHNSNNNSNNNNSGNNNNNNKKYVSLSQALAQIHMIVSGEQEKGAKPYQEDSTCIFYSPDLTVIMGAIFDGHGGLNGQVASSRSAKLTHEYFKKNWQRIRTWTKEQWRKEMISWFDEMHNRVRAGFVEVERTFRKTNQQNEDNVIDNKGVIRKLSGFPIHGGTTATVFTAIRLPTNKWRLVCANVGDSDCLLLARKPTRLSNNQTYAHLSVDHSPDSSLEYLRIKSLPLTEYPLKLLFVYDQADVYRKYECPLVFLENGTKDPKYVKNSWGHNLRPTNVRYDPAVYAVSPPGVVNDVTCIAMTRSLGDFYAHQFGLSHEPDITFYDWNCTDECVVTIGSDGIWDCWKWEAFADYVNGNLTKLREQTDKVTRTTLQHTIARAKACFGESSFDDASLVLVSLLPQLFPPIEQVYPNEYGIMPALGGATGHYNKNNTDNSGYDHNSILDESKDMDMIYDNKKPNNKDNNNINSNSINNGNNRTNFENNSNRNTRESRTKDVDEDVAMYGTN